MVFDAYRIHYGTAFVGIRWEFFFFKSNYSPSQSGRLTRDLSNRQFKFNLIGYFVLLY